MNNTNFPISAFTLDYGKIVNAIKYECGIKKVLDATIDNNINYEDVPKFEAIWDTGATRSVITENVVKTLGLEPLGATKVYNVNGDAIVNTYSVSIFLPNRVHFTPVRVTEGKLKNVNV